MAYTAFISVIFPCPPQKVYEILTDLSLLPLWNSAMTRVSHDGRMSPGLVYETETIVAGRPNTSRIEVVRMIPDKEVELVSNSGLVGFRAVYHFVGRGAHETELICELNFAFHNFVLNLARPVIESMAEARIRGDMEMLRALTGK